MAGTQTTIIPTNLPSYPWNTGDKLDAVPLNNAVIELQQQINSLQNALALLQGAGTGAGLSITTDWGGNLIVAAGPYVLTPTAPYQFTINSMDFYAGNNGGSFVVTVVNQGTPVAGLTNILVSGSTKTTVNATGGVSATVIAGTELDLIVSDVIGFPTNAYVNLNSNVISNLPFGTKFAVAQATGTSTCNAIPFQQSTMFGTATGSSTANATGNFSIKVTGAGTATGSASVSATGASSAVSPGTATGTSSSFGISGTSGNSGAATVGSATGTSTAPAVGSATAVAAATATGTSTAAATNASQSTMVGTSTGTSTANAVAPVATESATGTIATFAGQSVPNAGSTAPIFASSSPGNSPPVNSVLNRFALNSSGQILFNTVVDTSQSNVVQLAYFNHTVFIELTSGSWLTWISPGVYTPATNPIMATNFESASGTIVTSVNQTIFASSTPGTAAPITATVGHGLIAFAITANPGLVTLNQGTGFAPDTTTANVVKLAYVNHQLWQLNSSGFWFGWLSPGVYTAGTTTAPFATTPTITLGTMQSELTFSAFPVSGTYQDYVGNTSTNLIPQTITNGATVGTPGILPAGWKFSLGTGVTTSVVGFGNADPVSGNPYIDVSFSSTVANLSTIVFTQDALGAIPVSGNTTYIWSLFMQLVGGSDAAINGQVQWYESDNTGGFLATGGSGAQIPTSTSTLFSTSQVTQPTAARIQPGYNMSIPAGTNNFTIRFSGMQFETGATRTTFVPTPVLPLPVLNYQDNQTGSWLPFSSNAQVTSNSFGFIHPPITTTSSGWTVGVRDSFNTNINSLTNSFQVFTFGVVTLLSVSLSNTLFGAGQPAGSPVATINCNVAGGTFTGSFAISGADASFFSVSTAGGVSTLVNSSVLLGRQYNITITASMTGATNTPISQAFVLNAESGNGSSLIGPSGVIYGSSVPGTSLADTVIQISLSDQVAVNGTIIPATNNISQIYYIGHCAFQFNGNTWFGPIKPNDGGTALPNAFCASASPIPTIAMSTTQFLTTVGKVPERVATVSVNAGGTNNNVTLALSGASASLFSWSQTSTQSTITGTSSTSPTQLWTANGANLPASPPTYAITITASILP